MLEAAAAALAARGRCGIGDKTIYDALRPGVDAYHAASLAGRPLEIGLADAVAAAGVGALATRAMIARRGLGLRLGPRSAGHLDPGAMSCVLLLRALVPRAEETDARRMPEAAPVGRG